MILFGELGSLLELLELGLVLLEDGEELLFLFCLDFGLFFVGLDLLLEFVGLLIDLGGQSGFHSAHLVVLPTKLRRHQLHLLCALLLQLFVLHLQVRRLFLDLLVFLFRLRHIFSHLRPNRVEVVVKVFEDLFALGLLVILDLNVALLELLVLGIVLARYLLILLSDDVCLCVSVLVLQCLLVEELLGDGGLNRAGVDVSQSRHHSLREQIVKRLNPLLN